MVASSNSTQGHSKLKSSTAKISHQQDFPLSPTKSILCQGKDGNEKSSITAAATCDIPKSKSVHFLPYTFVVHVPHVNEYTLGELDDLYYNREDFANFRKNCKQLIQKMKDGQTEDIPYTDCTRGLEENTHTYCQNRRALRSKLQEYITSQMKLCLFCGEDRDVVASRIANYCQRMAGPSMNTARAVGVCDELEVRSLYDIAYNHPHELSFDDGIGSGFTKMTANALERARSLLLTNKGQMNGKNGNDPASSSCFSPSRASYSYRMCNMNQSLTSSHPVPRIA